MAVTAPPLTADTLIGQSAPPFTLQDQDGRWITLADLLQPGPIVLAFYPIDFSPVCTKQLCDYRDAYEPIRSLGIRIVGISPDPPERHREFITSKHLQFTLLSDPDHRVFRSYGVVPRWLSIRTRGVFVIGRDGRVLDQRIESTMFTHRGSSDLLSMLNRLKDRL